MARIDCKNPEPDRHDPNSCRWCGHGIRWARLRVLAVDPSHVCLGWKHKNLWWRRWPDPRKETSHAGKIFIGKWHPAKVNQLLGHWRSGARKKKADRELVCYYGQDVPKARGKRRVTLTIILGKRQRAGDADAYWKSLLDAMKHAGLIVDDNRQHVELAPVKFRRGPEFGTEIVLEDIDP